MAPTYLVGAIGAHMFLIELGEVDVLKYSSDDSAAASGGHIKLGRAKLGCAPRSTLHTHTPTNDAIDCRFAVSRPAFLPSGFLLCYEP